MGNVVTERNRVWQKIEFNAVQTKGPGAFLTVLTLDCKPLAMGKYRVMWNCEARLEDGATTSIPKIRVVEAPANTGDEVGEYTFHGADDNWDGRSGWDFRQYDEAATPSFLIQVRRVAAVGTDTVEVRRLKLSIELMNDDRAEAEGNGGRGRGRGLEGSNTGGI